MFKYKEEEFSKLDRTWLLGSILSHLLPLGTACIYLHRIAMRQPCGSKLLFPSVQKANSTFQACSRRDLFDFPRDFSLAPERARRVYLEFVPGTRIPLISPRADQLIYSGLNLTPSIRLSCH